MSFTIRPATPEDAATILGFITELAVYEKAGDEVKATEETIRTSIFGEGSVTEAAILEHNGRPAGFAVWFYSYSTWQAKNGLYLEDLYVSPDHRGGGAGGQAFGPALAGTGRGGDGGAGLRVRPRPRRRLAQASHTIMRVSASARRARLHARRVSPV